MLQTSCTLLMRKSVRRLNSSNSNILSRSTKKLPVRSFHQFNTISTHSTHRPFSTKLSSSSITSHPIHLPKLLSSFYTPSPLLSNSQFHHSKLFSHYTSYTCFSSSSFSSQSSSYPRPSPSSSSLS